MDRFDCYDGHLAAFKFHHDSFYVIGATFLVDIILIIVLSFFWNLCFSPLLKGTGLLHLNVLQIML